VVHIFFRIVFCKDEDIILRWYSRKTFKYVYKNIFSSVACFGENFWISKLQI